MVESGEVVETSVMAVLALPPCELEGFEGGVMQNDAHSLLSPPPPPPLPPHPPLLPLLHSSTHPSPSLPIAAPWVWTHAAAVREAYLSQAEQTVKATIRLGFTLKPIGGPGASSGKGSAEAVAEDASLVSAISGTGGLLSTHARPGPPPLSPLFTFPPTSSLVCRTALAPQPSHCCTIAQMDHTC